MSVYKPPGGVHFRYDFQLQGRRFVGNTEKSTEREARKVERQKRLEAPGVIAREAEEAKAAAEAAERMTFDMAAGRYHEEVGQHHAGQGADNTLRALAWLLQHIGPQTKIADIDDALVAHLVATRRGEMVKSTAKSPKQRKAPPRRVSNGTVNRSCTEMLRKVLLRARDVWKQQGLKDIDWGRHMLPEPQEIVRELREDQETAAVSEAREDYLALFRFSIATGMRDSECLWPKLQWSNFDWGNRVIVVKGKGGRERRIPITAEIREIVWPLQGRHPEAVFCYQVVKTRRGARQLTAGDWLPITSSGRKSWWRRFRKRLDGLDQYRWHDNRHTTGTRLLRKTGNLKMVQQLLGHSKIETTTKYAHVLLEDLRRGMEAVAEERATIAPLPRATKLQE